MQFRMNFGNQIVLAILAVIATSILTFKTSVISDGPEFHNVDNFPLVEQPDQITCGPTSALMLLKYYGDNRVTLEQVKAQSVTHWFNYGTTPIGMTAPDVLASALRSLGCSCKMMEGNISSLKKFVSEDRPTIVLVRSGEYTWHYVVVIGYTKENIIIADPGCGLKYNLEIDKFAGSWSFATNMSGKESKDKVVLGLISLAEVHPFTMIVPNEI